MFGGRRVPFGCCVLCGAVPVCQDPGLWGGDQRDSRFYDAVSVLDLCTFVSIFSFCLCKEKENLMIGTILGIPDQSNGNQEIGTNLKWLLLKGGDTGLKETQCEIM